MVELVEQWLKRPLEVGEVHDPTAVSADLAADVYLDAKGVAMHACALVARGDIGKEVCSFYLEYAKNIHGRIVPPMSIRCNSPYLPAGAESRPFVRAVTERLAGRLPAAAQRATHLHAFLAELVVQAQAPAKRYRTVLDTGDGDLAGSL